MQSIFWEKVTIKTTRYSKNVNFFLVICNSTLCMVEDKVLSAFLSIILLLHAPCLQLEICLYLKKNKDFYFFFYCPHLINHVLLWNSLPVLCSLSCYIVNPTPVLQYPAIPPPNPRSVIPCLRLPCLTVASVTSLYSAAQQALILKHFFVILLCVMLCNTIKRIFASNVCILVVPSHEGKNFQVHLAFPFTTLKKIEVFSYLWWLETNVFFLTKLILFESGLLACAPLLNWLSSW